MPTKLYLKIYGLNDVSDLKLVEGNLKSQDGIKTIKFFPLDGYSGVKMETDSSITKQQVLDIIKISGDFKIEDLTEPKIKEELAPSTKIKSENDHVNRLDTAFDTKVYFFGGLLISFSIISLIINIVFGYLLFSK